MAGVAHRIAPTAPAGADRHHEPVGFNDVTARCLEAHRTGYQYRAVGYHLRPDSVRHGLSARITTSSSVRHPRSIWPVTSSQLTRADSTGPNGIFCAAITPARSPVDRSDCNDLSTPDSAECTSSNDPPASRSPAADSHSGSSTNRPSTPASQARDGPAVSGMTLVSPAGGV